MLCPLLLPICPFAKATEGQIVSWGSWAGSNTVFFCYKYQLAYKNIYVQYMHTGGKNVISDDFFNSKKQAPKRGRGKLKSSDWYRSFQFLEYMALFLARHLTYQ